MSILDHLGRLHGTDKASGGHNYLIWYERFLAPMRDEPITFLEIGVGDGHSLAVWRDYFQRGRIVGMDIREDRTQYAGDRVEIVIGDSGNEEDLIRVARDYGPFDVVNDDGGHNPNDQLLAWRRLVPHLNPGGLYILEDCGGMEFFAELSQLVMRNQVAPEIESLSFYHEAVITVMYAPRP